ncbi:PAS domain-containing hybrid sensor histidine kinase/response regulator [Aliiglaciecola sp. LCG003]|uniref:PAS domain-containing hybrid sensor histidine kinase/response regulator n=1 Tax=Aliiglaciecola sp. LCG003 TaxID=3053655 RepID=UPI0025743418|nr:PAS domain-containing hybrid sensor histidine kinase/response regulator [Aliiglaciecola sp. LCG003]WJG08827.1 PAS domain-containing hybrid sensor histidine kinase/response regulator [Aliiglaciecola sp. LCG003]
MTLGWVALALIYLTGLFWIARWGEKDTPLARSITSHPAVYSLALAIYCTAWTFFGAVGEAARKDWQYLPILLGPALVYIFGYRFIHKLVLVSKKQNITTIADFISSRYGKRQTVALLVTIIALLATIPYVALQLKAIGSAFQLVSAQAHSELIVLIATGFIALFSIYFGTQRADVTEYRRGLILAIAFESSVKLIALICVAVVAYFWANFDDLDTFSVAISSFTSFERLQTFPFIAQTIMAAAAIICLPRQFHVAVVDNVNLQQLKTARWLFPLYLIATAMVIPILAAAGQALMGNQDPDTYVLGLAILTDSLIIKMLVFVGGLSAATAMIIIATLTLSTMLTNDVILPKVLARKHQSDGLTDYAKMIVNVRRIVIAALLLLAYVYHQYMAGSRSLASIGLVAFSLVIQLLPAILGGLYWKKGHAHGVYAGLLAGVVTWVLWLLLPLTDGEPAYRLQTDTISIGAMLSLAANTLCYVFFSIFSHDSLIDRIQAQAFVSPREGQLSDFKKQQTSATVADLATLMSTFLGDTRVENLISDFERRKHKTLRQSHSPDSDFLQFCELSLGGVIGASSAKALIDSAVSGKKLNFEEVVTFFDDTTQAIQFNATALFTSIESLDQGISVIDKQLKMVAWNKRYLELFDYPDDMLSVGTPIENLVRFNAMRGECGVGDIEVLVQKRVSHLKAGHPHRFVRQRSDGRMIEMVGNPLPGGGFVTSFNDITSHIEIQKALKEANINLERRIEKRGEEVQAINAELRSEIVRRAELETQLVQARKDAEAANASKTRFLALASHDVLQPLNAAKLYLSALHEIEVGPEARSILAKLGDSVTSSETLISTLLDISRLDQGEIKLSIETFSLAQLLQPLLDEFSMKAENKGLNLKSRLGSHWVKTDKTHLYRIVQNLLSNAVKYSEHGHILISARTRQQHILLQVWDTGIGISEEEQGRIFSDFYRVDGSSQHGVGLGLGVVSRMASKLDVSVNVRSRLGTGSCFSILVPAVEAEITTSKSTSILGSNLDNLQVLCIDDKHENLDAMQTLLDKWHIHTNTALNLAQALATLEQHTPNVLLVDYHLGESKNGIEVIELIWQQLEQRIPAVLVTANQEDNIMELCHEKHISYLSKPVKPAKLRALLNSFKAQI